MKSIRMLILVNLMISTSGAAEITRIWLSHRSSNPDQWVVNWQSSQPGNSVVHFGVNREKLTPVRMEEDVRIHHVEIPVIHPDQTYHYQVSTGDQYSEFASFKSYPKDGLRVAVVADWQSQPDLEGILEDEVHLLMSAGDTIGNLHRLCGEGSVDCTRPYEQLIDRYPELFRSTPFMPVLGNHDREIRARGAKPPLLPVYDIEATAFRRFFELPDREWHWHFDLPVFGARFIALDLNHISDQGTTWQTCHPFAPDSIQYQWYEKLIGESDSPWVITLFNERAATVRSLEKGNWGEMLAQGTLAVTGFGYFAERAEVNGLTCYNTSLNGRGDQYPDPHSRFLAGEDSYLLLTFRQNPPAMTVDLKRLDGSVLDRKQFNQSPLDPEPPVEVP